MQEWEEDNEPWASPDIQKDYEAALDRYILTFNRIDNLLSDLIEKVLEKQDRADLVKLLAYQDFSQKILYLDLLKLSREGNIILKDISIAAMKTILGHRNKIAHGHFDQNPFDGRFDIVTRKGLREQYSASDLDRLAKGMETTYEELRHAVASYWFESYPAAQKNGV